MSLDESILVRFRAALDKVYGERVERVVLFGSRARGDAQTDSDYDVAIFLTDLASFGEEAAKIAEIEQRYFTTRARSSMPCRSERALIAITPD